MTYRSALALLIALAFGQSSSACLWDRDTLEMERQKFPTTLELITGKFLRHSPQFYQWRIDDRQKKLASDPKRFEYYDDLAVAYDKLGQPDRAIELMLKKELIKPGLYETHANLATFYIHAGDLLKGLEEVDKALAINPEAHFGREKYQKYLVEYLISKQVDGKTVFPVRGSVGPNFADYLRKADPNFKLEPAIKGVLGMLRFARHDSPILLEVLGDLLFPTNQGQKGNVEQLAARAYLRASQAVTNGDAKQAYHGSAHAALYGQNNEDGDHMTVEELARDLRLEVQQANHWFAGVQQDELSWIAAGENPEENFAEKYYRDPEINAVTQTTDDTKPLGPTFVKTSLYGLLLVAVMLAAIMIYRRRNRSAHTI